MGRNGEWLPIGKVEPPGDIEVVYNMRVSGAHTFFVGRDRWGWAVWVHNAPAGLGDCAEQPPKKEGIYEGDDQRAVVLAIDPMQTLASADPRLRAIAETVRGKLTRVLERLE